MRPRNEAERKVAELSAKLPTITEKQKQWAKDTCFEKIGYYNKGEVWCMSCGRVHEKAASPLGIDLVGDETVCPHCGTHLKLKKQPETQIDRTLVLHDSDNMQGISGFPSLHHRKVDVQGI